MHKLLLALVIGSASVLAVGDTPVRASPTPGVPSVYLSPAPNSCLVGSGLEYWIYIHSPDNDGYEGVSFDLELSGGNVLPALITPEAGVTLEVADLWPLPFHIEASWTQRELEHAPILKVEFYVDPLLFGTQTPTNVVFTTTGGGTEVGFGHPSQTQAGCEPCGHVFIAEAHVLVPVGASTLIPFQWAWDCFSAGGGALNVTDTEGWALSWTPTFANDVNTCPSCFLPYHDGSIEVALPESAVPGTLSQLIISGVNNSLQVKVEAVAPLPSENKTWGRVKALYRTTQ